PHGPLLSACARRTSRSELAFHSHKTTAKPRARPTALTISQTPLHVGRSNRSPATHNRPHLTHPSGRKRYRAHPAAMRIIPSDAVTIATTISLAVPTRMRAG